MLVALHVVDESGNDKWTRRAKSISKKPSEWSLDFYLDKTLHTLQKGHFDYDPSKKRFTYVADDAEKDGAAISAAQTAVSGGSPKKAKFSFIRNGQLPVNFAGEVAGYGEIYSQYGLQLVFSWDAIPGTRRLKEPEEES